MTARTEAPAEGKAGMDLTGYGAAEAIGFTGIPPVHWVAAELFIAGHARDLAEQREVTEALGLDRVPLLAARREPGPCVAPDPFLAGQGQEAAPVTGVVLAGMATPGARGTGVVTEHGGDAAGAASATFSRDRAYRYALTRQWDGPPPAVFVMLNPSTAGALSTDPTVTRCLGFARRENCGGLVIVNLFALRATDPRELRGHPDPVGAGNDQFIRAHCAAGRLVIAAWGAHGRLRGRDQAVLALLREARVSARSLGVTAGGMPRHPLYLPRGAQLGNYAERQAAS